MYNMEKLLEVLNSKEFIEFAKERYESKKGLICDKCNNEEVFITYLKAIYVDKFLKADTDEKRKRVILSIPMHHIESTYVLEVIEALNASASSVNEPMHKNDVEYLKKIRQYETDPIFDALSERDELIEIIAVEFNEFTYMSDIKEGNYATVAKYRISPEEIKAIEKAVMYPIFNSMMHALYDESVGEEKPNSNYEEIENDVLKKMVFHTNKDNPEFEIILEDGTIVNYYRGDIRIKPFKIDDVIKFSKLAFICQYYNGPENEIGGILGGSVDQDIDPFDMSLEEFEENMRSAFIEVYGRLYGLDEVYSKKMIEDAKEKVKTMKKIIKEYNF